MMLIHLIGNGLQVLLTNPHRFTGVGPILAMTYTHLCLILTRDGGGPAKGTLLIFVIQIEVSLLTTLQPYSV